MFLANFYSVWKLSRMSGKFSRLSGNFPGYLESLECVGKFPDKVKYFS